MRELFGNYYGLDWIGMTMSLLFTYLVGSKKRSAFIFYFIGNIAWIFTNMLAHIWPGVILNVILMGLNIRGYRKWNKTFSSHDKENTPDSTTK